MNVAVIGCGMLARAQHIPNILACPHTRLHTCCDLDEGVLRHLVVLNDEPPTPAVPVAVKPEADEEDDE